MLHRGAVMPERDDVGDAHLLLHQALEDGVELLVGRQRILVLLVLAELRGRGFGKDRRRDYLALRPNAPVGPLAVPEVREPIDRGLVEVLDRIEAAVHVAVERGVADRDLRLVAGRDQHQPELVGERHQRHAAHARLDVLFRDVRRQVGEERIEDLGDAFDRGHDRQHVVADAETLGAFRRVGEALFRRVEVGEHDGAHAACPKRVDRHRRARPRNQCRRTSPARRP